MNDSSSDLDIGSGQVVLSNYPIRQKFFGAITLLFLVVGLAIGTYSVSKKTSLRSKAAETTLPPAILSTVSADYSKIRSTVYLSGWREVYQKLLADLPKIKDTGFNTVWLVYSWAEFDSKPLSNPREYNQAFITELKRTLELLRKNQMEVILPLVYVGPGYAPEGINPDNWNIDKTSFVAYREYVSRFLTEIQDYRDMSYILFSSENAMHGNHWNDAVLNARQIRESVGNIPRLLDPQLRAKFRLGFHDYVLINLDWSTCLDPETRAISNHCGAVSESPIKDPISFDFVMTVGYEMLNNYNAAPTSFLTLTDTQIKNNLQKRANRFKVLYPNTPLLAGEYGYRGCENGEDSQAKILKIQTEFALDNNYGLNVWSWKAASDECTNVSLGGLAITNPNGTARKAVDMLKQLFSFPRLTGQGVNKEYDPWAAWITGTNLSSNYKVRLVDNGTQWGSDASITLSADKTFISFSLPGKTLPSGCNKLAACDIEVKLVDSQGQATPSIKLTVPKSPSLQATITNAGVTTTYSPWAIWVTGTNLSSDLKAKVIDNSQPWGDPIAVSLAADSSFVSFGLSGNNPPSNCNQVRPCKIQVQLANSENVGSNNYEVELPATNPSKPPTITDSGVTSSYNPWAVWIKGADLGNNLSVSIFDSNGNEWANNIGVTLAADKSFASFVLPSNSPPSQCNLNSTCNVSIQLTDKDSNQVSNKFSLLIPKL